MGFASVLTVATVVAVIGLLAFTRLRTDGVMLAGVAVLVLCNVLTVEQALHGFTNEGVATVAVLYVVAHGLSATGAVYWLSQGILGSPRSVRAAQLRLMVPVALSSSVLNNTPVVAMMLPAVSDWARRYKIPVSQLMMPLSFAAIVGGLCTLIGTSTNLVVNGMLEQMHLAQHLALFDLAWIGVPCVIVVIAFMVLAGPRLLPNRSGVASQFADARQYTVEMLVEPDSPLADKSIEDAGLRHLPGLYLAEIVRGGQLIPVVSPRERLYAGDRLIFVGNVDAVVDLKRIRGLVSAEDQVFKLGEAGIERHLVEVVISNENPLLGKTVRTADFRRYYEAVILAVSRDGKRIKQRIGDIEIEAGDTMLLETGSGFVAKQRFSRDFLVVSPVAEFQPVHHRRQWVSLAILLAMVGCVAIGLLSMIKAAILAAVSLILTGCISVRGARRSISWQVLVVIAASLALGKALEQTGIAGTLAQALVAASSDSSYATMAVIFAVTAGFTAVISNVAAAVMMFPIAMAAAADLGVNPIPFAVTIMVAASASFATPIGYQTNLMVFGPGEYQFSDFIRMGVPLTALVGVLTVVLVPLVWPF